jgi:hypothetical protein
MSSSIWFMKGKQTRYEMGSVTRRKSTMASWRTGSGVGGVVSGLGETARDVGWGWERSAPYAAGGSP